MTLASLRRLVFTYSVLRNTMLIYPLYTLMFVERGGLSVSSVSVLIAVWTGVVLIGEIPTGVLADRYSRKLIIIISELLRACCFVVWLIVPGFWGYAIGFAIWGLGYSFFHGAYEALLYDELAERNETKQYLKLMSLNLMGMYIGFTLGLLVTLFLSRNHAPYNLLLWQSILASVAVAGIALIFPAAPKRAAEPYIKLLKDASVVVFKSTSLRWLVFWMAIIGGVANWFEEYLTLFYRTLGISTNIILVIMFIGLAIGIIVSMFLHKAHKTSATLRVGIFFASLIFLAIAAINPQKWVAVASMIVFYRGVSGLEILLDATLQDSSVARVRATVSSISAMIGGVLSIILVLSFSVLTRKLTPGASLLIMTIVIAIVGLAALPKYSKRSLTSREAIITE